MTDLDEQVAEPDLVVRLGCGNSFTTVIGDVVVLITCKKDATDDPYDLPEPPDAGTGQAALWIDLMRLTDALSAAGHDASAAEVSFPVSGLGSIEVHNRAVAEETVHELARGRDLNG